MKESWKVFFKTVIISAMCAVIFIGSGFVYLEGKLQRPAQNKVSDVPYSFTPENKGVLFDIAGNKTLIYLGFSDKSVTVIGLENDFSDNSVYGYTVDFTVEGDYSLLSGIIDSVGGIEIEGEAEDLSLTGVQVTRLMETSVNNKELGKEVVREILKGIAKNGFLRQDFLYIIENSSTNLTVPDCYYWQDYILEICKTVRFLN